MGDNTFIVARRGVHEALFQTMDAFTEAYREGWRAVNDTYNEQAEQRIKAEDEARNQMNLFGGQ